MAGVRKIRKVKNNPYTRVAFTNGRAVAVIVPYDNREYAVISLYSLTEERFGSYSEAREAALLAPSITPTTQTAVQREQDKEL